MGRRGERRLKELYDATNRMEGPEITPVLQGSCRIQGPVDESDHDIRRTNSGTCPVEKRFKFLNESSHSREESGSCNVCSAPCASCLHFNRTLSIMESNLEGVHSSNTLRRKEADNFPKKRKEADSCSFIVSDEPSNYKNKGCREHATSEKSIQLSANSSHDSYSENAESKATLRASGTCDISEDVNIPPKVSLGDAVGEEVQENSVISQIPVSSHSNPTSFEHHKQLSGLDLEKVKSEYHEDNLSCITGVRNVNTAIHDQTVNFVKEDTALSSVSIKIVQGTEDAAQAVASYSYHDHVTEACQGKSLSSTLGPNESLQKRISGSKDMEGDSTLQHQVEPFESSKKNFESLIGPLDTNTDVEERKAIVIPDYENKQTDHARSASGTLKNMDSCLEAENGTDISIPYDEILKSGTMNVSSAKPVSLLEPCNVHRPETQFQSSPKVENSEPDIEDVNVCDICGDAGREECLATCSRCSDGAEHTYCMRIMLDKVPEGDWLCEECKIREERENQKFDSFESVSENSKKLSFNENSKNVANALNSELLPEFDTKAIVSEETGLNKGLCSPKKHADNLGVTLVASKKASESSGGLETACFRKKSVLSRESSFKNLETGKGRATSMPQSCGDQSANTSQALVRSQTPSCSDTSKNKSQPQTSRGSFSKSLSFSHSNMKGKVIQLIEKAHHKEKNSRESAFEDRKKDGFRRTMSKSASFRSPSSGRSDIESVRKCSLLNSPRAEDPKGANQVKERNTLERKNSFVVDRSLVSLSPSAGTVIASLKPEQKTARHEVKSNNMSEASVLGMNKGLDNASALGCNEEKKRSSSLPKGFDGTSTNGVCNSEGQKPSMLTQRGISQAGEPTYRDKMSRDPSFSSSTRQAVPGGSRVLRCQKCNETGHATQFCSIDKLRVSALKPSAERISREGSSKISKLREAVESTISKNRMQKGSRLSNETEENIMSSSDLCSEVASKGTPSTSSCLRSSSIVGRIEGQGILRCPAPTHSKIAAPVDVKQQGREGDAVFSGSNALNVNPFTVPTQASVLGNPLRASAALSNLPSMVGRAAGQGILRYPAIDHSKTASLIEVKKRSREGDVLASLNELNVNPSTEMPSAQACVLRNPLRASAIPEFESIWQGAFKILRTGRVCDLFDGVQAHLSNCASRKVLDTVTKLPCNIKLEEVHRQSSWPSQFEISGPKEDNIALFFFAKDVESYERSYSKLLDNIVQNDLALRGSIDGVELLIFHSTTLPKNSQCWNMLYFLWGVFRERRIECVQDMPGFQEKPCDSSLDRKPKVEDVPFSVAAEVSEEVDPCDNQDTELSVSYVPSQAKSFKPSYFVDLQPVSSSRLQNKICQMQEPPCVQPSFGDADSDKFPLEHLSCTYPLDSISQPLGVLGNYSESGLQLDPMNLSAEPTKSPIYATNLGNDLDSGKDAHSLADVHQDSVQISSSKNNFLALKAVSPILGSVNQGMSAQNTTGMKTMEKKIQSKTEVALDENLMEVDHLSWESTPNRKRSVSCSMDSQASGETSKSTDEILLWGEKANCISSVHQKDHKKMKLNSGHASSTSSREETLGSRFSSKVNPICGGFLNEDKDRDGAYDENMISETLLSAERSFFPVDKGSVRDTRSDNFIHIHSSDDEDSPESNTPDLELALAAKKKPSKKEPLPLFFPLVEENNKSDELCADDGNDISASLSLSLAFPGTDKERRAKPIPQTERVLAERPCVNTKLLLFDGLRDT